MFWIQTALFKLFDIYVNIILWLQQNEFIKFINHLRYPKRVEPDDPSWVGIFSLIKQNIKYDLVETYEDYPKDINQRHIDFCNHYIDFLSSPRIKEHLLIAKHDDTYYCRTYLPSLTDSETTGLSDVEFIYIEYSHPKMQKPVELRIPSGMWCIGNELFTPAFVFRLLLAQPYYYIFDLDYSLKIVDHNIIEITLSSQNYIILEKEGYIIKNIPV
jgi:hypothetical protein